MWKKESMELGIHWYGYEYSVYAGNDNDAGLIVSAFESGVNKLRETQACHCVHSLFRHGALRFIFRCFAFLPRSLRHRTSR